MVKYTPANQLTLDGFEHPFDQKLDPNNRWVVMAGRIPWDELASIYASRLDNYNGRLSVDVRMVIGALIVKHFLRLSDRDTVDQIAENLYIQYFCGLQSFQTKRPFDPSLFVQIRERMGAKEFDQFHDIIIDRIEQLKPPKKRIKSNKPPGPPKPDGPSAPAKNKGTLKVDATVADQKIDYPTDLKLVAGSRQESERLIDVLYEYARPYLPAKPRTYRRKARSQFLAANMKRRKTQKETRRAIGRQLRYLRRNIATIHRLLDLLPPGPMPLSKRDLKIFWVIQHIHGQQHYMHQNNTHRCEDRIVSIYQPHVRPIVRGKDKARVEFGAKINIMEVDGVARPNRISWDAYNESTDLPMQVEKYRQTYGHYPALVLADRIYLTRQNRNWLKANGIRTCGKPLGRPQKQEKTAYQKRKEKKENNQRNHIEGKIGQAKNGYALNNIQARKPSTSESWIHSIFFVTNLLALGNTQLAHVKTLLVLVAALAMALFFAPFKAVQRASTKLSGPNRPLNGGYKPQLSPF